MENDTNTEQIKFGSNLEKFIDEWETTRVIVKVISCV